MLKQVKQVFVVAFVMVIGLASVAYAETMQSPDFQMTQSTIGSDSSVLSSSNNYSSISSTGDIGVGRSSSTSFQDKAGSKTNGDPVLQFSIDASNAKFPNFSPTGTATATATFSVVNYTSYGYVVQITGETPKNGSHILPGMTGASPDLAADSTAGTEQFGLNLVQNTAPSVGADPDHGGFGFGSAAPGYDVANKFRYVSGETIAMADKSSGKTTYTISFIANVNELTPGGQYATNQTLIVTGTY
ncbi:MAG TPA: hypothetical protein VFK03_01400 [Candidatus Saccharimonadales bacterium]|nr:hypothetical protein [Candidatus Saccharimonadales bacterium]